MLCGWNQTSVHGGSTACSQGKKEKKKVKRQRPQDLLCFCLLPQQKPSDVPSLFIENICLTGSIAGQKSTSSGVPIHASAGVLPLAMHALLVTLIELLLNYRPSAGREEPGTWVTEQIVKSKKKKIISWSGAFQGDGCTRKT
jgi:hypothetical protein